MKNRENIKICRIQLPISTKLKNEFQQYCEEKNISMSTMLCLLISKELKEKNI
jgi:antitoxin component of RelBE/YafQ-DinJ toxin-antitoxin module